jgi:pilus assembly protein Flp/PilA
MKFITGQYRKMKSAIAALKGEKGQTLVEYALLLVLIAIVVIGAVTLIGTNANKVYCNVANRLGDTGGTGGTTPP